MKKLIFICCLCAVSQAFCGERVKFKGNHSSSSSHCERGPRGDRGARGHKGRPGAVFEINDVIEVTTQETLDIGNALIPFSKPIDYPTNGIDVPGGMALIESVLLSGIFDTITLPIESTDTFYQVSYGVSVAYEEDPLNADFQLVLNGTALPYTTIGVSDLPSSVDHTSVIMNPANTFGTLSLLSLSEQTTITPASENSFSAYMTVVKLNNNAP